GCPVLSLSHPRSLRRSRTWFSHSLPPRRRVPCDPASAMVPAPRASALAGMLWPAGYSELSGVVGGGKPGRRDTAVRASAHASPHRYGPRPATGRKDQELGRCAVVRGRPLVVNRRAVCPVMASSTRISSPEPNTWVARVLVGAPVIHSTT